METRASFSPPVLPSKDSTVYICHIPVNPWADPKERFYHRCTYYLRPHGSDVLGHLCHHQVGEVPPQRVYGYYDSTMGFQSRVEIMQLVRDFLRLKYETEQLLKTHEEQCMALMDWSIRHVIGTPEPVVDESFEGLNGRLTLLDAMRTTMGVKTNRTVQEDYQSNPYIQFEEELRELTKDAKDSHQYEVSELQSRLLALSWRKYCDRSESHSGNEDDSTEEI